MGDNEFGDRLRLGTYKEDPEVHFGLAEKRENAADWTGVPERLVNRLTSLAEAYELHYLPRIDIYGDTVFKNEQCKALDAELQFVRGIVKDPALAKTVDRISDLVKTALARSQRLVVSGN